MEKKHHFTSDEKLQYFGYGEWVEEPDEVIFVHDGFTCHVLRVVKPETDGSKFGGHFCGYILIPKEHPWYGEKPHKIDSQCHGAITWSGFMDEEFWIGFDCGHSNDIIPSIELHRKTNPRLKKIYEENQALLDRFKDRLIMSLFETSYKNLNYVIEECKSVVEQAKSFQSLSLPQSK